MILTGRLQRFYQGVQSANLANATLVAFGTITGYEITTRWFIPRLPVQRLATVAGFLLLAVCFYLLNQARGNLSRLSVAATVNLTAFALLFLINIPGENHYGLETLFGSTEKVNPSQATCINFILLSLSFLLVESDTERVWLIKQACCWAVILSSSVALLGMMFNLPFLYFEIKVVSYGQALPTALFFVLFAILRLCFLQHKREMFVPVNVQDLRELSQKGREALEKTKLKTIE